MREEPLQKIDEAKQVKRLMGQAENIKENIAALIFSGPRSMADKIALTARVLNDFDNLLNEAINH